MTPLLWLSIAVLVALVPLLPLKQISTESLEQTRDYWLLGMLSLATIWLATAAPPLAPIGLWLLFWWRDRHVLETAASWAGIAGFWLACRALPPEAWPWIARAWCVVGTGLAGALLWQWYTIGKNPAMNSGRPWWIPLRMYHTAGWMGQRILAGAFFALVLPFYPIWALPIPLLGLFLTSSWAAGLAACGAFLVLYPSGWPFWVGSPLLGAVLALTEARGWRWRVLEFTPRGHSLDSVWQRVRISRLTLRAMGRREWWPWGYGSRVGSRNAMETAVIRWAARYGVEKVPTGHIHNDALHYLFEYGLPGVASLGLLAALLIPTLQIGDPWSACVVAGAVLSGGSLAFRYPGTALIWLASVVHVVSR